MPDHTAARRQLDGCKAPRPNPRHEATPHSPNPRRELKNPRPSAPVTRHQAVPTAESFAGKSPPNLGEWRLRGAAIGAGARGAARFGEMTHLGGRIRVGGGGGSRSRRRSLPRAAGEEGTRGGGGGGEPTLGRLSVPYFSGRSFFDTVPQVSANQIPAPDVDKVTAR
ncbi:hypothetical protein PAHAL_3G439600 [Panicum hallii]|uniref:Uncharacterized protein n=1 Tax=Panicum hallii TaxID=206008 RepID=A0A2T8KLF9_9POAL|nr:hypothetical protein PAHAL_3G439600 [Panicum hallii]